MPEKYEQMKKEYMQGWRTWNNRSVLSYVHMPEGLGIRLGIKSRTHQEVLANALIGTAANEGEVMPRAHSYDGSYTDLTVEWRGERIRVQTGLDGDDLVALVTPENVPFLASNLIVAGVVLWNRDGYVKKGKECLELHMPEKAEKVYATGEKTNEVFAECTEPYLSVSLSEEIGISTGRARTVEEIRAVIEAGKAKWQVNMEKYGDLAECYNAMQTCQAWDTIYNPLEDAPNTTVSRIWNRLWGGYVMFCWDSYFGALMQAVDEKQLAYCNAISITNSLTPSGFVPNYACQDKIKSYDRSQPPVGSMTCLEIYKRHKEEWFLREVYDKLLTWNQWFITHRQTKNGLLAWGSDPYEPVTGVGLEFNGVADRQGAAYESGLDNSPMYDDTPYDEESHCLMLDDVGLTGLYIHDCRCLSEIAGILGDAENKQKLSDRAEMMEERMEELWDEETGMYLNRRTDTGTFDHRLSPFHFHALFSRKVGQERAERIIREHMLNPEEFWGEYVLPSIARNDPAYPDNDYWRGRIWAPMNFLAYMAMREYDLPGERKMLAEKSAELILKEWLTKGHVHENYDAENGEGCHLKNSDRFYHWGGLLSMIALMEKEG